MSEFGNRGTLGKLPVHCVSLFSPQYLFASACSFHPLPLLFHCFYYEHLLGMWHYMRHWYDTGQCHQITRLVLITKMDLACYPRWSIADAAVNGIKDTTGQWWCGAFNWWVAFNVSMQIKWPASPEDSLNKLAQKFMLPCDYKFLKEPPGVPNLCSNGSFNCWVTFDTAYIVSWTFSISRMFLWRIGWLKSFRQQAPSPLYPQYVLQILHLKEI